MRSVRRTAQVCLSLAAALFLLVPDGSCLVTPVAGSAGVRPMEQEALSPGLAGRLPAGSFAARNGEPATILEMFASPGPTPAPSGGLPWTPDRATLAVFRLSGPVFTWNPSGGTYSLDWGDVDRDGDLDLVTAAGDRVSAYLNEHGRLAQAWSDARQALGVRWLNQDSMGAEPNLEIVLVGESTDGQPSSPGRLTIYQEPETSYAVQTYDVAAQLLRVEAGDFDGDRGVDLVASTNALDPPGGCPVLLFRRQSSGLPYGVAPECVSQQATAALAAADADGDGDLDLALALHRDKEIRIVINDGGALSVGSHSVVVEGSLAHIPYDLAWGDYDRDGLLDLAAAFPLEQQLRIYHSDGSMAFTLAYSRDTSSIMTPLAVDWADLDNDGRLELIAGDQPPVAVRYDSATGTFSVVPLAAIQAGGRVQEIRAVDAGLGTSLSFLPVVAKGLHAATGMIPAPGRARAAESARNDSDGDLDLSIANQYRPSQLYANSASILGDSPQFLATAAQDAAWGDFTRDGRLDLALATETGVDVYASPGITLTAPLHLDVGQATGLAWGDVDGDGDLDLAVGGADGAALFKHDGSTLTPFWSDTSSTAVSTVAWGDFNSDGHLDLAVGGAQGIALYRFVGADLAASLEFSASTGQVSEVAWADYDGDFYPDLAVAGNQGVQVYHNQMDEPGQIESFAPLWPDSLGGAARSVAWADYDGDGRPELAAGLYGAANVIYDNQDGVLGTDPTVIGVAGGTTQLAWGDWDDDGDPDLAVANYDGSDVVYANVGGALILDPAAGLGWESPDVANTTGLAWGDMDRDGDLDLAVTGQDCGLYANNLALPAHLGPEHTPLPQNLPVLSIGRPGGTDDAYLYSTAEVLGTPADGGQVSFDFFYYDPEGDPWASISFQFSLDGGGTWTPVSNIAFVPGDNGHNAGHWNARADQAVSDNARLRAVLIAGTQSGLVQKAQAATTSPPFRVRGTDCTWSSGAAIQLSPTNPGVGDAVIFYGSLEQGTGQLTFTWDFDDGTTAYGQQVTHRFQAAGAYRVKLRVEQAGQGNEFCPTRPVMAQALVTVSAISSMPGLFDPDGLHLPLIVAAGPATASPTIGEGEQ